MERTVLIGESVHVEQHVALLGTRRKSRTPEKGIIDTTANLV